MGIIERNIGNLHDQDTGVLVGYLNPVTHKQEDLNAPALQALVSPDGKTDVTLMARLSSSNTGAQNTAAITAAVAAMLLVAPGGGTIAMPQGDYNLAGTADLDSAWITEIGRTGITLRGAGIGGTVLRQQTAGVSTFRKSNQVTVNFEEFTLYGPGTGNANSVGIEFTAAAGAVYWKNVWIENFGTGSRFIDVTLATFDNVCWRDNARNIELGFNCDIFNFNGCRLDYATDTSVYIGYRDAAHLSGALQCNNISFNGCRISNNATAFDIADYGASNIFFNASYFEANTKTGWYGDAAQAVGPKNVHFVGSFFTVMSATTPQIEHRNANQESSLKFDGCRSDATGFAGLWLSMGLNSRLVWEDNDLLSTGAHCSWNGTNYTMDKRQSFAVENGVTHVVDGSVAGSLVPIDIRMTNGTSKVYQAWSRRNASTGAVLGISNPSVTDYNGQFVAYTGAVRVGTPTSALPTASATYRGIMAYQEGGGGVADTVVCCMKDSAGAYSWKVVATG